MNNELLEDIITEDGCYECDDCSALVNPNKNTTGYVFYDIKNREALLNW